MEKVRILLNNPCFEEEANKLSSKLGIKIYKEKEAFEGVYLVYGEDFVSLEGDNQIFYGDYENNKTIKRLKHNNLTSELLVKAVKPKNYPKGGVIFDATAGLGEDSLLLAAAGFNVKLFERDEIIAELLKDTIKRARNSEFEELRVAAARMDVIEGDSIKEMEDLAKAFNPDVVYLDPMFPEREKSSLVKKKFQLLHVLEKPCSEEEELLSAALLTGAGKVIIKRPLKGPFLCDKKPSYQIVGKTVRYDCLVR